MANTATQFGNAPIRAFGRGNIEKTVVVIDTTGADVTILAANAENSHFLVGGSSSKTTAVTNLIFKAGGTTIGSITIPDASSLAEAIDGFIKSSIWTKKNQALTVQSDVAITLYLDTVTAPDVTVKYD